MGKLLAEITIPQFITKIQTAKKARPKYYKKKKNGKWSPRNLPPTFKEKLEEGVYSMKGSYLLNEEGEKKLANPGTAGKPRYETLSGNKLLSGYGSPHLRAKLARGLKDFYRPYVQDYIIEHGSIKTFPLRVTWDLFTTVEDKPNWDVFNLFFYYKYFEDSLHEKTKQKKGSDIKYKGNKLKQLIPDDNVKFITWPASPKIIPVNEWTNRKFVFRFFHDNRKELNRKPWLSTASSDS